MALFVRHPAGDAPKLAHRAARIEDRLHRFLSRRARRHGHVTTIVAYTGYGDTHRVRILARVLLVKEPRQGSRAERRQRGEHVRGWRAFLSVPVSDARVTITIGGRSCTVHPDRGGVVDHTLAIDLDPGWHTATLSTQAATKTWPAPVFVVDPRADFGIVSDVDDTVMVTALPRPFLAAWNTFVVDEHARVPTPGIAVMLERLVAEHAGGPVVYVSTGAWNVAPAVTRFLSRNLYPPGPLLLTDWGPTHDRFFRSGTEHKRQSLERLHEEFPQMRWLLLGDDGQHDEQTYDEFALRHPDNVAAVAIRQLSPSEAVLAGRRKKTPRRTVRSHVPWVAAP
ncbi:MAG TPA: phosphatase domain-containing protein, partial [Microbacteriaceae bacterium]|nr:phosphatase domain-containing protein [Microbacteriaceae bacterium]